MWRKGWMGTNGERVGALWQLASQAPGFPARLRAYRARSRAPRIRRSAV